MVLGGGQPTVAARPVAPISGHALDAPALTPPDGGEALDLCATARSSARRQGASSADHYNGWRPHRRLDLAPPNGRTAAVTWTGTQPITVNRRDRLGGLLHEYDAFIFSLVRTCVFSKISPLD